jgi:biotin carboxylase
MGLLERAAEGRAAATCTQLLQNDESPYSLESNKRMQGHRLDPILHVSKGGGRKST